MSGICYQQREKMLPLLIIDLIYELRFYFLFNKCCERNNQVENGIQKKTKVVEIDEACGGDFC